MKRNVVFGKHSVQCHKRVNLSKRLSGAPNHCKQTKCKRQATPIYNCHKQLEANVLVQSDTVCHKGMHLSVQSTHTTHTHTLDTQDKPLFAPEEEVTCSDQPAGHHSSNAKHRQVADRKHRAARVQSKINARREHLEEHKFFFFSDEQGIPNQQNGGKDSKRDCNSLKRKQRLNGTLQSEGVRFCVCASVCVCVFVFVCGLTTAKSASPAAYPVQTVSNVIALSKRSSRSKAVSHVVDATCL